MKRIMDILFSGIGMIALMPLFAVVAIGIKIASPGTVFFRQHRMGLGGEKFKIFKFRTMKVQALNSGCQVTANGDSRVTPIGRFLRHYKLDELPQLINVFLGHMALVGPRPEVPEFAELFPAEFKRILQVRPGITHPATLFFRREEEILAATKNPREFYIRKVLPEKLAAYESNLQQSLLGDFRTICETIVPRWTMKPYGPEHFAPEGALGIMPFPINGENSAAGSSSIPEETLIAKAANSTNFPN